MATDIVRVSVYGTLPGGEVWSINPCFRMDGGDTLNYSEALAAVAAINAVTVPANLRAVMSSSTAVTGCRVEGRSYAGELQSQADGLRTAAIAGSGSSALPFQSSMVLSLRTVAAGPSGRGRLYWPATGVTLNAATLRPASGTVTSFLADFKTYLQAIQTALDGVVDESVLLAVWSRKNATSSGVAKIMAGDILDTQRRRRDNVPESYQELVYFAGAVSQLE